MLLESMFQIQRLCLERILALGKVAGLLCCSQCDLASLHPTTIGLETCKRAIQHDVQLITNLLGCESPSQRTRLLLAQLLRLALKIGNRLSESSLNLPAILSKVVVTSGGAAKVIRRNALVQHGQHTRNVLSHKLDLSKL